jgi:hypothetical protein
MKPKTPPNDPTTPIDLNVGTLAELAPWLVAPLAAEVARRAAEVARRAAAAAEAAPE